MSKSITFVLAGSLGAVGMVSGCEDDIAPAPHRGEDTQIDRAQKGSEQMGDKAKDATDPPGEMKDPDRSHQAPPKNPPGPLK